MYVPTEIDLNWGKDVLRLVKQGGILVYPNVGLMYEVDHEKKRLSLLNSDKLTDFFCFVLHMQTQVVFHQLEYIVTERESS